jgi:hypothetical protein
VRWLIHGSLRRFDFTSLKERNGVCGFAGGGRILE